MRVERIAEPTLEQVVVFGTWHLGAVTSACLAHLGLKVTGVEGNASRLTSLSDGVPPLYEPGLAELMQQGIDNGRLRFVADPAGALLETSVVIFAEDIPVSDNDEPDVSPLLQTLRKTIPHLREGTTVIVMSQVPLGTCEVIQRAVADVRAGEGIEVAYCPENLRLGEAIERFLHPDMVIIGVDSARSMAYVARLFAMIEAPKVFMDVRSAEMTKHALNALLATATSFGNELGDLCERVGVDAVKVIETIRMDGRIGSRLPLLPGPPFAGGTLARDLRVLLQLASSHGVSLTLLESVIAVNERQKQLAFRRLEEALGDLGGRRVAILGLTYKPETSTIKRSTSIDLIQMLTERRAEVTAYDPKADLASVSRLPHFERAVDAYAAAQGADAVVIMTDWPEFRALDLGALRGAMRGTILVDVRNTLDANAAVNAGLKYYGTGRRRGA